MDPVRHLETPIYPEDVAPLKSGDRVSISGTVYTARDVAYEELGPEAIRELTVEDLPAIVVNDTFGNDLYVEGRKNYRKDAA